MSSCRRYRDTPGPWNLLLLVPSAVAFFFFLFESLDGSDTWHRITEAEIRESNQRKLAKAATRNNAGTMSDEPHQILLLSPDKNNNIVVVPADEDQADHAFFSHNRSNFPVRHSPVRRRL